MRRRRMGRAIVIVPSIFTLSNLFFGFWSMVLASQGDFYRASWWIVIAGVLDMLDGATARMSNTGSRFGAELDSLVDVVSFGIAPAVLMYHLHFADQGAFAWVFCYGFAICVAIRLARYNVTEHAPASGFTGLPSPAAGMTLATYYPFTQTSFFQQQLSGLPWNSILIFLPIGLGLAMLSSVQYARLPRIGVKTLRGLLGLSVNLTMLGFGLFARDIFFFPLGIAYVSYGMLRGATLGFLDRSEGMNGDAVHPQPTLVREGRIRRRRRHGYRDRETDE